MNVQSNRIDDKFRKQMTYDITCNDHKTLNDSHTNYFNWLKLKED